MDRLRELELDLKAAEIEKENRQQEVKLMQSEFRRIKARKEAALDRLENSIERHMLAREKLKHYKKEKGMK